VAGIVVAGSANRDPRMIDTGIAFAVLVTVSLLYRFGSMVPSLPRFAQTICLEGKGLSR